MAADSGCTAWRAPHTSTTTFGAFSHEQYWNGTFLMPPSGDWSLSTAYDLAFSAGNGYALHHQMTIADKADDFTV